MRSRAGFWLAVVACAFGFLLLYPLRGASPTGDDFFYLALGPQLDTPADLLLHDSTASYFFRPVVMLLWWATSALTRDAATHYAINIALHMLNGLLLFALLRRLAVRATVAALAALVFIAHVTTFSAAAWLSVRFDLVSLAFGLGALIAVHDALVDPAPTLRRMSVALAFTLMCVFSKETGFSLAATACLAAAWPDPASPATGRARAALAMAIAACVAAALAARWMVLRPEVEASYFLQGTLDTLWQGLRNWAGALPLYLVVQRGSRAAMLLWALSLVMLAALASTPAALRGIRDRHLARAAMLGLALGALSALVQAPVAAVTELEPHAADDFSFGVVVASRLYYVPFAGFCILGAAVGEAIARAPRPAWPNRIALAAFAIAALGLVTQSRYVGHRIAAFTDATGPKFLNAAMEQLRPRTTSTPGCKIYLLDTPQRTAAAFRAYLHAAAIHVLPRDHPVTHCFLLTEHAPWYNILQRDGLPPHAELPLETMTVAGKPFLPLHVGNLTYYFLRIPDSDRVRDDPAATFLSYEDGRFVDVTADVRARRRAVHFVDNRPPS